MQGSTCICWNIQSCAVTTSRWCPCWHEEAREKPQKVFHSLCAGKKMDQGTCRICLQTLHLTSSISPEERFICIYIINSVYIIQFIYSSTNAYTLKWRRKKRLQYSQNRTLQFLCLAQAWLCLRWSDLHQRFYCRWSRSLVSYTSTGNALLHFHLPHQQYLKKQTKGMQWTHDLAHQWTRENKHRKPLVKH